MAIYIGIDPGWKNCAYSIVEPSGTMGKVQVIKTGVLNPSENEYECVKTLSDLVKDYDVKKYLTIERFVPYNKVFSSDSENITMLIGMLKAEFYSKVEELLLIRAIDWKIKLVQINNKLFGYQSPSTILDKKYSLSIAKFITNNYEFKTDHEADATCLASTPLFNSYRPRKKTN